MTPSSTPPGLVEDQSGTPDNTIDPSTTDNTEAGENDISPVEIALLDKAGPEESKDEDYLQRSNLDELDEDGELLNEADDLAGDDLDVPGSEIDDANEAIGEEDEENNSFSMRDQDDV
jgi:hypothetical protein